MIGRKKKITKYICYYILVVYTLNLQKLFATLLNYEKKSSVNNKPSPYLIVYLF